MTTNARIVFLTALFEAAHCRKPKGFGWWLFDFGVGCERIEGPGRSASYADAKAWATARARELGVSAVAVCP